MICVLTLFGEMDLQPILRKKLQSNDIFFIEDNCATSVQLTTQVETRSKEVDAVIIYSAAMNMEILREYVEELRVYTEHLRVILILNGAKSSFLRSIINDYWDMKIDLIFDDNGFDTDELIELLRKGKLTYKDFKEKRKESGFVGDIDDIPLSDISLEESIEDTIFSKFKEKKEKLYRKEAKEERASYLKPQGHFTIGVFNTTRGAGATWTTSNIARYFAMHNYKCCIADMSSTEAAGMMKLKNIDIYTEEFDIEDLKSKYNVTVIDFGTPIEISAQGDNFKLMSQYTPKTIQCFTNCDIKIIMGFTDPWNIEKMNFFFINDTWRNQFDNSYLFIVAGDKESAIKLYPEGNFYTREDDYREYVLDAIRREEEK